MIALLAATTSFATTVTESGPFSIYRTPEVDLRFKRVGVDQQLYIRESKVATLERAVGGEFPQRYTFLFPAEPIAPFKFGVGFSVRASIGSEAPFFESYIVLGFSPTPQSLELKPNGAFFPALDAKPGTIGLPQVADCFSGFEPTPGGSPIPRQCEISALGVRRGKTFSGFEIEEVAFVNPLTRTELAIGHNLGVVRFHDTALFDLPAPKREGAIIEYRNTVDFPKSPGGQFFYTSDAAEAAFVDSGAAGKFVRTGKSFNAGGVARTCRFFGSLSPGPNSHFYTVSESDCTLLRGLQKTPQPRNEQQWNFEGYSFATSVPKKNEDGSIVCPQGTVPVFRAYNQAFADGGKRNAWDSNHRFSTNQKDIDEMVALGWKDEGVQMCAPV